MRCAALIAALTVLSAPVAQSVRPPKPIAPPIEHDANTTVFSAFFKQYIDHDRPWLGTFNQKYWYNSQWWKGHGAPVVLFTPGEEAAAPYTGYLTNRTITGVFAENLEGAVVMLEHRYWGDSSPYSSLSTKNMQYLTLKNSIADLTHFARTVDLPFDTNNSCNAKNAPWVLSGGSYSGALAAWTASTAPGTFWAYHSSSAPVEAIDNYWQYFSPIQEGMAKNCSSDINLVIEHIDHVLVHGSRQQKHELKDMFGLADLEHDDDFAGAIENGPWQWQSNEFYTGYSGFFEFCDYVENIYATPKANPGPQGVGLQKALAGYADWFKNVYFPGSCANYGYWTDNSTTACYNTYNASSPLFTDYSVNNTIDRQWNWMLCNEPFFYWQDGAPSNNPTLVSRTINSQYWKRQCALFFPTEDGYTYGSRRGRSASDVNRYTGGWQNLHTHRLTWTTGQYDPWRTSGVSSEYRPGGPLKSTPSAPVNEIPGGVHCYDLLVKNGEANPGVAKVIQIETDQIKTWVDEYYRK